MVGAIAAAVPGVGPAQAESVNKHVFVIVMENKDKAEIYGNTASAPYINNVLIPNFARADNFVDELPGEKSQPHYIYMEAGTNVFPNHTFNSNDDPSGTNSVGTRQHLTRQIANTPPLDWVTYQQSMGRATGYCPIKSAGLYHAKHNPFVYFRDISGIPPSATNAYCIAHHKQLNALPDDLANNRIPAYVFITPNICNDMHGDPACPSTNGIKMGDDWLANNMPRIIRWARANNGVIFLTWDEARQTKYMPFIAIGPTVKKGFVSNVQYDHGSMLKTIERILGLPFLDTVKNKTEMSDLFKPGMYP